jgi:hypothetical protein
VEKAQKIRLDRADEYAYESAPVSEEHVRTRAVHEVIPTIHRERDVAEIRHAVLPVRERIREAPVMSERILGEIREPEYRTRISEEERRKNQSISQRLGQAVHEELPVEHEYIYEAPRVAEIVRPRIIHEVHPVIQRDIEREHYEREYLPIHERIIEGPRVSERVEVLKPITREEWERSRGGPVYKEAGWRYGRDADDLFREERSMFEDLSLGERPLRSHQGKYRPIETRHQEDTFRDEEYRSRRVDPRPPLPRHTLGYLPTLGIRYGHGNEVTRQNVVSNEWNQGKERLPQHDILSEFDVGRKDRRGVVPGQPRSRYGSFSNKYHPGTASGYKSQRMSPPLSEEEY